MTDYICSHFITEKKGSVGLEMAIALPVLFCLLMVAVDLCRFVIAQSLLQSVAIAEINMIRSQSAGDIENVTAAQVQSALRRRLGAGPQMWIDTDSVDVWFGEEADLVGWPVYFTQQITPYSPFRKILAWRQSYENPLVLYLQPEQLH